METSAENTLLVGLTNIMDTWINKVEKIFAVIEFEWRVTEKCSKGFYVVHFFMA